MALVAEHPLSAGNVKEKLVDSIDFRIRLNFESGDEDVISDGRNINFRPKMPDIKGNVRIYQNNEITWIQDTIVVLIRYVFVFSGRFVKIESTRNITPVSANTSRSEVTVEMIENQASEEIGKLSLAFIRERHERENLLLGLSKSSQIAIPDSFALPYDRAFADMRDSLDQLEQFLQDEAAVDPSVSATVNELQELHRDISEAACDIMNALRERDTIQQAIRDQSREVALAATAIDTALTNPTESNGVSDSKNDVAFAVSLIPLVVAIFGFILDRRR